MKSSDRPILNRFTQAVVPLVSSVLIIGSAVSVLASPTAFAASKTLYVGHGSIKGDSGAGCWSPGYNSVQAAVDAATTGETVYLCGAPFAEQVFINKSITLTGDSTSGLTANGTTFTTSNTRYPGSFKTDKLFLPQALLVTSGATTNVTVNYLTIAGPMPSNGGCAEEDYGVLALSGNINMFDDSVLNIADSNPALYGCQFGVGVEIGSQYWTNASNTNSNEDFAATATLDDVKVSGYQKNGVTADGNGSSVVVEDSTITGGGPAAPFGSITAQNGVQISRGASGSVKFNSISANQYSGPGYASSAGVVVYGGCADLTPKGSGGDLSTGVNVYDNTLTNNDIGVALANYNPACTKPAANITNDKAYDNDVSDSAVTNISGLCDGSSTCGGALIGYQAGIEDVGNSDSVYDNDMSGAGYASQGTYDYTKTPPVFTQTGPNSAFVRPVDAGDSFPTTHASVYDNTYHA